VANRRPAHPFVKVLTKQVSLRLQKA
jgi:hypothetical protein